MLSSSFFVFPCLVIIGISLLLVLFTFHLSPHLLRIHLIGMRLKELGPSIPRINSLLWATITYLNLIGLLLRVYLLLVGLLEVVLPWSMLLFTISINSVRNVTPWVEL
uniref:Uncharacterized protein n=1 Tax=Cacopsylla melanoneura TaxID=428564 RepID=A0A8D8SGK6_9HEMI